MGQWERCVISILLEYYTIYWQRPYSGANRDYISCPGKPGVNSLASLSWTNKDKSSKQLSVDAYFNTRFPDLGLKRMRKSEHVF